VENQYFAAFVAPKPPPRSNEDRLDAESMAVVIQEDPQALQKADVAVAITSKPLRVGPNLPVKHTYQVFTGPKTSQALAPYGAEGLAAYRKNLWFNIPFASSLAQNVIAPLLDKIYLLTKQVAGFFGFKNGNYGIAIILLTLTVRMMMFPLGRKQALMAKKMQDLQPYLKEIQEKYKDDKEQQTKETWALYKRHKANPIGGCLPALIQMPILVGLWQALNNSVPLRNASFLYIENLAVPRGLPDAGADQALLAAGHDAGGRDAAEDDEVHDDLHGLHVLQGPLGPRDLLHHEQPLVDRRADDPAQDHEVLPGDRRRRREESCHGGRRQGRSRGQRNFGQARRLVVHTPGEAAR